MQDIKSRSPRPDTIKKYKGNRCNNKSFIKVKLRNSIMNQHEEPNYNIIHKSHHAKIQLKKFLLT